MTVKKRGLLVQAAAYTVALVFGALTLLALAPVSHPLLAMLGADLMATMVIFVFSLALNNSSMYDPYWSVAPIAIAAFWAATGGGGIVSVLLLAIICAWGVRLTWNFARGWSGLGHEDWRYVGYRKKTGWFGYWGISLGGFHLFPTLAVFAGMIPAWFAFSAGGDVLNFGMILGAAVSIGGILLEGTADNQLRDFQRDRTDPDQILAEGVWAWCRHPNYLGEILFWWGIWLFGVSAASVALWGGIGALIITIMFQVISLPLIDDRMLEKRPHYAEHIQRRPAIWPISPPTSDA
ncbi:MAG: steroid 5-alpha reductase family enzyme [Myxococcota bacterium]|jgi:steroid 5-alpha reductase family enzyme